MTRLIAIGYWLAVAALIAVTIVILIAIAELDQTVRDAEQLLQQVRR